MGAQSLCCGLGFVTHLRRARSASDRRYCVLAFDWEGTEYRDAQAGAKLSTTASTTSVSSSTHSLTIRRLADRLIHAWVGASHTEHSNKYRRSAAVAHLGNAALMALAAATSMHTPCSRKFRAGGATTRGTCSAAACHAPTATQQTCPTLMQAASTTAWGSLSSFIKLFHTIQSGAPQPTLLDVDGLSTIAL